MTKTSAKVEKDRLNTVRGVASTSYPARYIYGRTESRMEGRTDGRSHIQAFIGYFLC